MTKKKSVPAVAAPNPVPPYPEWLDKARIPSSHPYGRFDKVKGYGQAQVAVMKLTAAQVKEQARQESDFAHSILDRVLQLRWGIDALDRLNALPDGWVGITRSISLRVSITQPYFDTDRKRTFEFDAGMIRRVPHELAVQQCFLRKDNEILFTGKVLADRDMLELIAKAQIQAQQLVNQDEKRQQAEVDFVKMFTDAAAPLTFWGQFIRAYPDLYDHMDLDQIDMPKPSGNALVRAVPIERIHATVNSLRTAPPSAETALA